MMDNYLNTDNKSRVGYDKAYNVYSLLRDDAVFYSDSLICNFNTADTGRLSITLSGFKGTITDVKDAIFDLSETDYMINCDMEGVPSLQTKLP